MEGDPTAGIQTNKTFNTLNDVVNDGATPKDIRFIVDGVETVITVQPGATLGDLADAVNAKTDSSGVRAVIKSVDDTLDGPLTFELQHIDDTKTVLPGNSALEVFSDQPEATNWTTQRAQNAEIRINGWPADPRWLEVPSNTVKDYGDDGLTFNLRAPGQTTITIDVDAQGIMENVYSFVEAVNVFRYTVQELTAFDESNITVDMKYATSQFDMQKGGVLQGNYGIQLVTSRLKTAVTGSGLGFLPFTQGTGGNADTGDLFTALSQVGIYTNTDQGSEMFGMLEIHTGDSTSSSQQFRGLTLEEAIRQDPVAVARLFAAGGEGSTNSPNFGHVSHINGTTKPGVYDVKYSVDGDGNVTGTINGKTATFDPTTNQLGIYSHGAGGPNQADGLVVEIYNLAPGESFSGQVNIKQGKVNELLGMIDGSEGFLGKDGPINTLIDNYKDIVANIEKKITQEEERIVKWERAMKLRFARLEAMIAEYEEMGKGLESQIQQLGNNKK